MMTQAHPRSVLLIGVQDAGKTNFLSRLWIALDGGGGLLSKAGLPADLDYLTAGASHLLRGEFAPHTPQEVHDRSLIPVRSGLAEGFSGMLVVPDLPGEQVAAVFRTRQWSSDWEDQINDGCGCLMLIRADSHEFVAALDWVTCAAQYGAPVAEAGPQKDNQNEDKPPTQVVLVDWLQFLRKAFTERVGGGHRPRVGIMVTAWDLVPPSQQSLGASAWVKENLPLLFQFVNANDDDFEFAYFGMSVTSGDLAADADFKKQYLKGDPRHGGEVVHQLAGKVEVSRDVTLPVAWALGLGPTSTVEAG